MLLSLVFSSISVFYLFVGSKDCDSLNIMDNQAEMASKVLRRLKRFSDLDLSMVETEILSHLMDGRRTSKELVFEIYGTEKTDPSFIADYYKIRRGIRNLQGKGYVAAPLFGKEKLYRLTPFGIASIARLAETEKVSARLVPGKDAALYALSLFLGLGIVLSGNYDAELVPAFLVWAFLISVGASCVRLLETFQKVA